MKAARKTLVVIGMIIGISLLIYLPTSAVFSESSKPVQEDGTQVFSSDPVSAAVSRPVRDIPSRQPEQILNREINPMRNPGLFSDDLGMTGSNTTSQDPLVALSKISTGLTPDPNFTFEGLGTDGFTPPDTMGEVGPNHYVQMVNVSFAIYDKSGNVLVADTAFTDLYTGSGLSACESQNDGDPVVLWDSMADRWLLSQFAVSSSPYHMCIAISQTPDPTGAYHLYEFEVPDFPDYFKFGVWPDAYYMGSNTGFPNQYYAYAFDRVAMLAGQPATYQYSNGHPNFPLPADLDGPVEPPANTPGYFYTMLAEGYADHPVGVDRVVLYEFDVDWDTPANSTYGIAQEIPIADYNYTTCGFFAGDCIPQPGTSQRLDSVDPWPMWRFAYRNLGSYEAMVGNFTVDTNGTDHAGIRWFELQKSGASWDLHQEGTHAPDSDHRWMGSIAMDGSGNIALGYSISSDTTYPSLRYATRLAGDPLGTLQAEATLYAGGGSQTGPYDRWGDYSSMNVDPTDECTFWYTGEYHDVSDESFNWNTRIGTFRIPECTGSLGPDFAINAAPNTQEICVPDDAVYDVTVNYMSGFDGEVTLSAVNLPTNATASFVPTSVTTPTTDSVLTIGTTGVAYGSYDIDIVGVHVPTPTHTTTVGLDLFTASPAIPTLTTPSDGATSISLVPTFVWNAVAQTQNYNLEVAEDAGFTTIVYTATVATTSHTMSGVNLDPETVYYWRVKADNICGESNYSAVYSFTTTLLLCSYPEAPIGDNATTTDYLVSSESDTLSDLDVYINISHTWIGDLTITLTNEDSATSVVLLPTSFICSSDNIDATFDDEAIDPIACGASAPALSGYVIPAEALSLFDFNAMAGTWRLDVADGAGGDQGTLHEWCLAPQLTDSIGTIAGTVTDVDTSAGLEGAVITVDDGTTPFTALTDVNGDYARSVPSGTFTVSVDMADYFTDTIANVVISEGVTTTADFALTNMYAELYYSPDFIEEYMELGNIVTNTVTITNPGNIDLSFTARVGEFGGPGDVLIRKVESTLPVSSNNAAIVSEPIITSPDECAAYENYAGREPVEFAKHCAVGQITIDPRTFENAILAPTDTGYAQDIGFISDNFVSFTLNDFPGQTVMGTNTDAYYGMDFDPAATTLYALNDTTGQLGTIELATGAFTPLVSAPAPGGSWTGLSIDPTNGTFYASTATGLYTVEPATGVSTHIGDFSNTTLMIDIAVGPTGDMYGHAIDTDSIYTIDKTTGTDTLVGSTGYNGNFAQGMDFDNGDGTLYIFLYIGGGANVYGTVDLTTGAVTPLATDNPQGEFEGAIQVSGSGGETWVRIINNSGSVAPGETATFEVVFDSNEVEELGTYTAELSFSGNFENEPPVMPLTMHVLEFFKTYLPIITKP